MTAAKPVVPRERAERDVEDIVDHLVRDAGLGVALRFIDAYGSVCARISAQPAAGSPRFGWELELPGLRAWPIRGFGHLVFYMERADVIDVWRVLHTARDIPRWLSEPAEE